MDKSYARILTGGLSGTHIHYMGKGDLIKESQENNSMSEAMHKLLKMGYDVHTYTSESVLMVREY